MVLIQFPKDPLASFDLFGLIHGPGTCSLLRSYYYSSSLVPFLSAFQCSNPLNPFGVVGIHTSLMRREPGRTRQTEAPVGKGNVNVCSAATMPK